MKYDKSTVVNIRMSETEKNKIYEKAQKMHLSISTYLKYIIFTTLDEMDKKEENKE